MTINEKVKKVVEMLKKHEDYSGINTYLYLKDYRISIDEIEDSELTIALDLEYDDEVIRIYKHEEGSFYHLILDRVIKDLEEELAIQQEKESIEEKIHLIITLKDGKVVKVEQDKSTQTFSKTFTFDYESN